jgi:copper chaperone CopZ
MQLLQFQLGMMCLILIVTHVYSACTGAITRGISSQPGVSTIDVNLVLNSAVIVHDPDVSSVEYLIGEIEDLGYGATLIEVHALNEQTLRRTTFGLVGMTCR